MVLFVILGAGLSLLMAGVLLWLGMEAYLRHYFDVNPSPNV